MMTQEKLQTVKYRDINVRFLPYLDGGGRGFGQQYLRVIKEKLGRVNHVFEYCAGPGFIGFSLLAHGLCDKLTLADINPDAVECVKKTIKDNHLENKVSVYLSDCLKSIPSTEKWDLIVSNPPHWPSTEEKYKENIRNFDPGLRIHQDFYDDIHKFLNPDGSIILQELGDATTDKDFTKMIEDNGLKIIEVFKAEPLSLLECVFKFKNIRKNTKPSSFYFIWSKRK
jgi:methylase of polypeptide subunit release factors